VYEFDAPNVYRTWTAHPGRAPGLLCSEVLPSTSNDVLRTPSNSAFIWDENALKSAGLARKSATTSYPAGIWGVGTTISDRSASGSHPPITPNESNMNKPGNTVLIIFSSYPQKMFLFNG